MIHLVWVLPFLSWVLVLVTIVDRNAKRTGAMLACTAALLIVAHLVEAFT